jgi:hypoxanthine-guanine phosphoribosyltransferase
VRDAFTLSWRLSDATRRRRLTGRVVVLVDDVRTTGATLDACARVLASTGVREVRALTLAHAPIRPGPVEGASRRRRGAARTGGRP